MKIGIVRKKYIYHGGSESFSQNFMKRLSKEGHEIHIFAMKWQVNRGIENIFFHKVPALTFNSFLRDLTFAIFSFIILKRQREDFDVIQSHDKTLFQDVYRAGDGCHIEWLRQRWKREGFSGKLSIILNPYHWTILILERMIFNGHRFKKVVAISELVKKNITDNYYVSEKDIEVVYNGVDLERFNPKNREIYRKEVRKLYSITDDDIVILFVGSGFERKGVEYLLKAVEGISRPLTILIVGRGSERRFKNLIKRQKVIFCGPQEEVQRYYAASDIFVFPTIYEPFGNVHLEALASGLPVITTKLSGAAEIIQEGLQGFIIDRPENIEAIAEKIEHLMERERNKKMGFEARRLAERFSLESHAQEMLRIYRQSKKRTH
ncbi:MAG: glycosyltransferase family 4 protein [Nitrospirota bacterium]